MTAKYGKHFAPPADLKLFVGTDLLGLSGQV